MIVTGLRALLIAQPAIAALVGHRVYVNEAAQGAALPYIVLTTLNTNPHVVFDGTYGMRSADVDVDCWAGGYVSAKSVADAVTAFLADYRGPVTGGEINAVIWQSESDGPIPPADGSQTGRHLVTVEFQIQHTPN